MKKLLLPLAGFVLLLTACEKNIKVDVPRKDPKLVINAWSERDKPLRVRIGKSRHILDPDPAPGQDIVSTARPILFENNVVIDTLRYNASLMQYTSPRGRMFRAGQSYRLSVEAQGFATAETGTGVPSTSSIAGITRVPNARVRSTGESLDEVTVRLNDPSAERNFYLIRFYTTSFNSGSEYPIDCVSTSDKDVETIGYGADPSDPNSCYDGERVLVKDANFNGREKSLRFFIASDRLQSYTDGQGRRHRPYVRVYRITEEYFKYLKSYAAYEESEGNPFGEPVNVYSNVLGGLGVFSAYTAVVDTIR